MNKTKEKLTEVKIGYARIVVILLAVNLLLTGYTMTKIQEGQSADTSVTLPTPTETVLQSVPETEQ